MSLITLQFSQLMALPIDDSGLTITDNNGGTFTTVSVSFGSDNSYLVYDGTWAPDDPVNGVDVVQVIYSKAVGALIGVEGMEVENFNVIATYGSVPIVALPVSASLSSRMFYSFDIQQTLEAPLNKASAEFNSVRF